MLAVLPSRHAALKAFADVRLRQIAADEHDAADARLVRLPVALMVAVEDHVHALKHEALRVVLERQDALAAQNARTFTLNEVLNPREEAVGVERLVGRQRKRLHLLIVIVLQATMAVTVVVVGIGVALLLNERFPGNRTMRIVALLPWAVAPIATGVTWKLIFHFLYGLLNGVLFGLGIIPRYVGWLEEEFLAFHASILATVRGRNQHMNGGTLLANLDFFDFQWNLHASDFRKLPSAWCHAAIEVDDAS